jgi:hypothetical protein
MLEKLDQIDWAATFHAHGKATDVPGLIRRLAVDSEPLESLYGNIFHQGTRYPAAIPAIPFLRELVDEPSVPNRHKIIYLLVHLAIGYQESQFPFGFRPRVEWQPKWFRSEVERTVTRNVYRAVRKVVDSFLRLVEQGNDQERAAAAFAVAWFPADAHRTLPVVRAQLAKERLDWLRANHILAMGLLNAATGTAEDLPRFRRRATGKQHAPIVQIASSLAAYSATKSCFDRELNHLLEAYLYVDSYDSRRDDDDWFYWDLTHYLIEILSDVTGPHRLTVCETLIPLVTNRATREWHAAGAADILLRLGFRRKTKRLTELQAKILTAITSLRRSFDYRCEVNMFLEPLGLPDFNDLVDYLKERAAH